MSMIGKTLGSFECTALLGKGGMGEVYKAKDQKLGRDVAIKVLPEEFAKDADRVARFQREAKLLASLNHPNIAAIYGLEESDGAHFLVLELIEGDTLADRLKRGAIPAEEALKLSLQIAEALEAAHERGVIHRDLKPTNIKVTPDGKVKVLDFGLAKAFAGDQEDMNLSNSPTLSAAATQRGIILGTAAYMSPEQARGKPVDKRTDIWAFGVVLYEMLTGQSAFQGEDVSITLASVIKGDANLNLLPPSIHPRVREAITRCLQSDIRRRYSSIADARYEIEQTLSDPSGLFVQPSATAKPRKKLRVGIPWVAAAVALAAAAVWMLKPAPPPEPKQVMRFDYELPESQRITASRYRSLAVSPDGTKIVYAADNQLYLKNANEFPARPIQGTDEDPLCPFFSPDGQWIGYGSRTDNQLKKIAVMGGASVTLCKATPGPGASWGTDGMIVFGQQGAIMRVSDSGGTPEEIVKGENGTYVFPQILPDGKSVLFTIAAGGRLQVAVQSFESGEQRDLFPGGPAQYLPTGHIVYGLENNLMAVRFDPVTLEAIGGPVPLVEGVFRAGGNRPTQSAISSSGTLIYLPGTTTMGNVPERSLVWVDRQGKEESIAAPPNNYAWPRISPDGMKVALGIGIGGNSYASDIWIWDVVRENMTRLTFNESGAFPLWSPDGRRIAFLSGIGDKAGVYWKAADGTGKDELLGSKPDRTILPFSWSSDSNTLVTCDLVGGSNFDIGSLSVEGDHSYKPLLKEEYREFQPQISPDGQWMAYTSNESGEHEVYVRPFPDVDSGRWQVSTSGGSFPLWAPDGGELFFIEIDDAGSTVMAVSVETEPTFKAGKPEILFQAPFVLVTNADINVWDISPDGKRFIMVKSPLPTEGEPTSLIPRKINIVVNWFEELKDRVPVD